MAFKIVKLELIENFLKFASKKEVRDRLKEFDAPNLANFVDPDTFDKINASKKTTPFLKGNKKPPRHGEKTSEEVLQENKARIMKMKELYGMFVKMEGDGNSNPVQELVQEEFTNESKETPIENNS